MDDQSEAVSGEIETFKIKVAHLEEELKRARAEQSKLDKKLQKAERSQEIAENYNESLRKEINSLREQLHVYKSRKYADGGTQTEEEQNDLINVQAEGQSIAESLRSTAEAALSQSGYVYDETTGLYYDYKTGYYYDSKNQLYYDANTGIYYYFNQRTKSYQFHSQVALPQPSTDQSGVAVGQSQEAVRDKSGRHGKKKAKKRVADKRKKSKSLGDKYDSSEDDSVIEVSGEPKHKKRELDRRKGGREIEVIKIDDSDDSNRGDGDRKTESVCIDVDKSDSEMEEGEISDSSKEEVVSESESEMSSSDAEEDAVTKQLRLPAPCVRLIVTESESLKLGTLFIITCTGGTIGREESSPVCVPEVPVSKNHAEIGYNEEARQYWIRDSGSQNGTWLNENQLTSQARTESECSPLSHGDTVRLGTTTLRIHIHPGDETCDDCEPGQVQAVLEKEKPQTVTIHSKEEREKLRKKQLKQIKKKYMLAGVDYEENKEVLQNPNYTDRADHRRKTVGSDNPHQKDDLPASVHVAIADTNVGHKMMKKMGWKEGQLLGKHEQGLDEPIQVVVRDKKAGLGSGKQRSMDQMQYRNPQQWDKARERFRAVQRPDTKQPSQQPSAKAQQSFVKGGVQVLGNEESTGSETAKSEQVSVAKDIRDEKIFDI